MCGAVELSQIFKLFISSTIRCFEFFVIILQGFESFWA